MSADVQSWPTMPEVEGALCLLMLVNNLHGELAQFSGVPKEVYTAVETLAEYFSRQIPDTVIQVRTAFWLGEDV